MLSGGRGREFKSPHSDQDIKVLFGHYPVKAGFDGRIIGRFRAKVGIGGVAECWPWKAASTARGYGRFKLCGRLELAHVVAYAITQGPIPRFAGRQGVIRHSCDNPRCCNPAHLIAGTQAENVADMIARAQPIGRRPSLSQETIEAIAAENGSSAKIAEKYGVTIGQVKWYRGSTYRKRWAIASELRGTA